MKRLRSTREAFGAAMGNRPLRRLLTAHLVFDIAGWLGMTGMSVYAYGKGGAGLVGLATFLRMIPGVVVGPVLSTLADRGSRSRVLTLMTLGRGAIGVIVGLTVVAGAPTAVVLGLPILSTAMLSAWYPARTALATGLAAAPEELAAANVVGSSIASTSIFIGPALGGILLASTSVALTLALAGALQLLAGLMLATIREPARTEEPATDEASASLLAEARDGFVVVWRDPRLRVIVGLMGAQILVDGALSVLSVTMAFELLHTGEGGIGSLYSALGVGGVVGAVAAAVLAGSKRLASPFLTGLVLWGVPLVVVGIVGDPVIAVVMLLLLGFGNTLLDVAGYTLIQRVAEERMMARVFSVFETLGIITGAVGVAVAPLLVAVADVQVALIVVGAFLPLLALVSARIVIRADAPPPADVALIRAVPMFAPLAPDTLERLARAAARRTYNAGEAIITQGDEADRFHVIEAGEVEVFEDGHRVRRQKAGASFGEIGLLRGTPRTATVTARAATTTLTLDRDDFLAALGESPRAEEIGRSVASSRLGSARRLALAAV